MVNINYATQERAILREQLTVAMLEAVEWKAIALAALAELERDGEEAD